MSHAFIESLDMVKQVAPHKFMACCPAHEDKSPSMAISEIDDRLLVHCFAGCTIDDVTGAVGMRPRDLFFSDDFDHKGYARGRQKVVKQSEISYARTVLLLAESDRLNGHKHTRADNECELKAFDLLSSESLQTNTYAEDFFGAKS